MSRKKTRMLGPLKTLDGVTFLLGGAKVIFNVVTSGSGKKNGRSQEIQVFCGPQKTRF